MMKELEKYSGNESSKSYADMAKKTPVATDDEKVENKSLVFQRTIVELPEAVWF